LSFFFFFFFFRDASPISGREKEETKNKNDELQPRKSFYLSFRLLVLAKGAGGKEEEEEEESPKDIPTEKRSKIMRQDR
jgi:hypothetical protein